MHHFLCALLLRIFSDCAIMISSPFVINVYAMPVTRYVEYIVVTRMKLIVFHFSHTRQRYFVWLTAGVTRLVPASKEAINLGRCALPAARRHLIWQRWRAHDMKNVVCSKLGGVRVCL